MAAARGKASVPVGSAQWIRTEREQIAVFHDQEIEDFAFSTRNEFEWLNEHMAEIFSDNQLNVTEIFKTPGKLRGKTPRTGRRNPMESRAPLTNIFSTDRRFNASPLRVVEQKNDAQKPQSKQVAETLVEDSREDAVMATSDSELPLKTNIASEEDELSIEPAVEDRTNTEQAIIEPSLLKETDIDMAEAPVNATENMEIEQSADERRTTEGSFHSARENVTSKDVGQAEHVDVNGPPNALTEAIFTSAGSPGKQAQEAEVIDAMDIEEVHATNEDNHDLEASPLSSEGFTPDKPLVRKSSLKFASLPGPEPFTTKRSLGTRVSRTSNLDTAKNNALNRASYLGRYTGGKSLGPSRQADDQNMDVDEPTRPEVSREESDGDGKISKLHNKSSTQRLHERINLLGKTQHPRPTKSIPTTAVSAPLSYSELSSHDKEDSPARAREANKLHVTDNAVAVEDDDEDWIKPPAQSTEHAVRPTLSKSRSVDVMEQIDGKESIGGKDLGMGPHDREVAKQKSPLRAEEALLQSVHEHSLKKATSTTALVSPLRDQLPMQEPEQQNAVAVSNPTMPLAESNTPAGSPSRFHLEGHLSASKSKLQSIMKSARGLFTSSAGVSAQAKMEALSPPASRVLSQDYQPMGGIAEAMAEPLVKDKSLYPSLPNESQTTLHEGRRTRSSTEKEEKKKDKESKDRQRAELELMKAREQERRKAKDYKDKKETAAAKVLAKSASNVTTLESSSKPIRQSPRRQQAKEVDAEDAEPKDMQNMAPPPRPESQQISHGQKGKEARRPAKPTAKPKPAQVSIRVGTVSQMARGIPLTTGALSSSLQDTMRPTSQKQQVVAKKASNSSIQTSASNTSFKSSVSSNSSKPKSLILAAQKREQAEKEAQRKDEDKRERERRRAALQEEAHKREQRQREEMERQRERDRLALAKEEAKKLADRHAAERRRLEMKKAQQEQQRAAKELAQSLQNEKAQSAMNGHRADTMTNKPPSRMDKLSEFPKAPGNHPGPNASKAPIKRVFDPDNDDELSRPAKPPTGQNYQQMDSKRRRTGDEESYEPFTRPTMAPPIRPSDIRKVQNTTTYSQQTYGHKPQEGLKSSMFNGNYPTAPPPAASHASSSTMKASTAGQGYQHHGYNEQASRPAHPMDMAKYTNGKIPFAEAPNPPAQTTAYKTPLPSSKQQQHNAPSTSKSSPMYTNGDNIHLDEIPTDSEEEDSEDERERKANIPDWARTPNLFDQLGEQERLDADAVFGPVAPLNMEEMFKDKSRHHRFRSRTSSANWFGSDRLTEDDIRKDNAAREKLRQDGAWTYGL